MRKFFMKLGRLILNNFWLKAISLIFACMTWFYVMNMIENTTGKTILAKVLPSYSKMITKKIYVKPVLVENPPDGFKVKLNEVTVDPPYFILAGPRHVLEGINALETMPVSISRFKDTAKVDAEIAPASHSLDTESLSVKVTIPIEKIEENKEN